MQKVAYKEMFENELTHAWYLGTRKLLVDTLKKYISRNSKILDAGCGTGGTFVFLKKAGFTNITCIDNSSIALKYSKKREISNLQLASVNKLPFKKNSFDAIICMDVLYHKGINLQTALGEFYRVLKRGGIIYIQEPAFNWLTSKHDKVIQTDRRFARHKLAKLLKGAKFKIIKLTYFNTFLFTPILIKRLFDKFLHSKNAKSDVQALPSVINGIFLKTLGIEAKLTDHISLPFGLSVICLAKKEFI